MLHPDLRKNLASQVDRLVHECQEDLDGVRKSNELGEAWRQYARVQERSQELFSGCFEFIGGAAFRREMGRGDTSDEGGQIGEVADELMVEAASAALGRPGPYFTVPALEEALAESRVRTIRLRFPDWTTWNLPLMAHDFGHVAISDYQVEREFRLFALLKPLSNEIMSQDEPLQRQLSDAPSDSIREQIQRRAEKAAERRVRVLLADSFATWWMGPAYACAAIHLRFDPSTAYSTNPYFNERADMVIKILHAVAETDDHHGVANTLGDQWKAAVEEADPPDASSGVRADAVALLEDAIRKELSDLPSATEYATERWYSASAKSAKWIRERGGGDVLDTKPGRDDGLRDVLNAAWLCRLKDPEDRELLTEVARAALTQCEGIVRASRNRRAAAEQGGALGSIDLRKR
jgi:hypothetical protein